ncbi:hypothetical protein Acy02nite_71520 [Actinoplanes cyaneus]|uniref:Uncharacterized protein n=1 Tax=Actinoplanes cyaneus TaxID=52696 RepID=A0A919IQC6_9ACTN|nr:hypothetical protein Acy02nite_71520 [Actinoplanes cyaneus]
MRPGCDRGSLFGYGCTVRAMTSEPGAEPPPVDPGSELGVELLSASFTVANATRQVHRVLAMTGVLPTLSAAVHTPD